MVEDIYKLKNDILKQVKKEVEERGVERIDVNRTGTMIDMIHHLAEAEQACWEAQYYRAAVTNSMEQKYGYSPMYQQSERMGYQNSGGETGSSARMGYGSNMGYGSMGYSDNIMEELKRAVMAANPDDRMHLKNEINSIIGSI